MNVLIASNRDYLKYTMVMLYSLFMNNDVSIDVYMPYNNLRNEDIVMLESFISFFQDKHFHPIKLDGEFDKSVTSHNNISIETYYRILAIDLLPKDIDRILYLDVDMIIQGSLESLYWGDLTGYPFLVCEDILGILNGFHEANKFRMGIPPEYSYFNAGVMLFNLEYLRKTNASEMVIDRIYKNQDRYEYNDQDVLNEVYYDKLRFVPWDKYNCPPGIYFLDREELGKGKVVFASYNEIKDLSSDIKRLSDRYIDVTDQIKNKAIIIHYMGNSKPWKSDKNSSTFSLFNSVYFEYEQAVNNIMNNVNIQ